MDSGLSEHVPRERRNGDAAGLSAVEERLDLPVPFHPLGEAGPARASLPRSEDRPDKGKNTGRLDQRPGRVVQQMLLVPFGQLRFEIIVHQGDRQVGGALDDSNSEPGEGRAELCRPLNVEGLNAHATFLEISRRGLRQKAEARPIGGYSPVRKARRRKDIAALDQPLQGFVDLVGGEIRLQIANKLPKALSALPDRGGERAIELTVKQEFPVLGIEAHDIRRQNIDGEIRRELRNLFTVELRGFVSGIACHEVSTRTFVIILTPQLGTPARVS